MIALAAKSGLGTVSRLAHHLCIFSVLRPSLTQPVSRTDILCPSLHPNPNLGMGLVPSPDLRGGHGYNVLLPSL